MRLVFQERLAIITVESIVARLESRQIRACRATAYSYLLEVGMFGACFKGRQGRRRRVQHQRLLRRTYSRKGAKTALSCFMVLKVRCVCQKM